jgi:class 3 adenylate cyclase
MRKKEENKESLLLSKAQIALVGAIQWVLKTFDNTEHADLEELSMRISCLYIIADNNLLTLDFNEREKNIMEKEEDKIKWIDHYLSKIQAPLEDMIKRYELILDGKIKSPEIKDITTSEGIEKYAQNVYKTAAYDSIFSCCYQCPEKERLNCFCLFKTFLLCVFGGNRSLSKKSSMKTLLEKYGHKFGAWLKNRKYLLEEGEFIGYPYLIEDHQKIPYRTKIDPYVTTSLLYLFRDEELVKKCFGIVKIDNAYFMKNDEGDSPYTRIIRTIKEFQFAKEEHKKEDKTYLCGDSPVFDETGKYKVFGSWEEGFWGGIRINRVKSTASIARMLYEIDRNSPIIKEIVKNAKIFVEGAFKPLVKHNSVNKNYIIDDASFRDIHISIVSDISGTISGLLFLITIKDDDSFDIPDGYIEPKINWLIDQQRPDGAFPSLSDEFIEEYKNVQLKRKQEQGVEEFIIKNSIKENKKERKRLNISLNNTIDAIELLILYLEEYGNQPRFENLSLLEKAQNVLSHKKKITVCSIDMANSTKFKEAIETFVTTDQYRKCVKKAIKDNGGDINSDWSGDGIMYDFQDPAEAINASFQIQKDLDSLNKDPEKNRSGTSIMARIGVNTGEIFIDGKFQKKGERTGNVLNYAGHLQKHCPSGKILISKDIYEKLTTENKSKFKKYDENIDEKETYVSK